MARKIFAEAGSGRRLESHHSAPKAIPLPYTRHWSSRKVPKKTLMKKKAESQARNATAYPNSSAPVAVALKAGNRIHIPQHATTIAAAISNHPRAALTASKRNRLTGRERVKYIDPCRPFVA